MKHRTLPPDVAASWRNLLTQLSIAADLVEDFAHLTEQLAARAENEADVRALATTGVLFAIRARKLVQLTRETVGD